MMGIYDLGYFVHPQVLVQEGAGQESHDNTPPHMLDDEACPLSTGNLYSPTFAPKRVGVKHYCSDFTSDSSSLVHIPTVTTVTTARLGYLLLVAGEPSLLSAGSQVPNRTAAVRSPSAHCFSVNINSNHGGYPLVSCALGM